jgi:hypothetical protein
LNFVFSLNEFSKKSSIRLYNPRINNYIYTLKSKKSKFLFTMRKLFTLLVVAGTFTFVACEKKQETSATDSTTNTVIEAPVDTTTQMAPAETGTDTTAATTTAPTEEKK